MPKKLITSTSLVIVESPAKCKKIEEYLGLGYKCMASYGHIRELPSIKNIDIENKVMPFTATYVMIDTPIKKRNIEALRHEINNAYEVILATDDDREGEAIAWHLCQVFHLDINKTKRIIFHEITETALQTAIANPQRINLNVVLAQQTRQILDILVGFKISPVLWKLVSTPKGKEHALSAGRCQTPALKLVYENQEEINKSDKKKVYNTTGYFTNYNLPFELNKQIENEDIIIKFLNDSADFSHVYSCSQPKKVLKQQPEPFTTSRIQQVASNELHYSPKETMQICQSLYEGGYITYMRTDSKVYSGDFIKLASDYITNVYDSKYFNTDLVVTTDITEVQKQKGVKFIQEAHEAIRPTNISVCELPKEMENKERRLYKLIWTNTLESCMVSASYFSVTATITAPLDKYIYSSELIDFLGWKIVEHKFSRENKEYQYLQSIKRETSIPYKKITSSVTIKGNKSHYTEARLVQLLEEKGIGRPSTFSYLVDKIQERGYVKKEDIKGNEIMCKDFELEDGNILEIDNKREFGKEKNKLVIQPLGTIVMDFLNKHFNSLFNYQYTGSMEGSLDNISNGELSWLKVCSSCNNEIDKLVDGIKNEPKIEFQINENHTYIVGKYGPIVKCVEEKFGKEEVTFKQIKRDINISKLENGEYKLNEIINSEKTETSIKPQIILGEYEGKEVILRKGRFGLYVIWGSSSINLKELGNRPIENITFEEVKKILEEGSNTIREINKCVSIRKGPKGDYLFYKTSKMKKPQFFNINNFINETQEDYKICDPTILKSWIESKYKIKI